MSSTTTYPRDIEACHRLLHERDHRLVEAAEEQVAGYNRRKKGRKPRDEQLPAHLERYEVTLDVPEDQKNCPEHGERQVIGYDRVETLEMVPATFRVRVTLIPKLACSGCPACGVVEAPRPEGLVEGNRFDTSVAAAIITAKYGYHQPILLSVEKAVHGLSPLRPAMKKPRFSRPTAAASCGCRPA